MSSPGAEDRRLGLEPARSPVQHPRSPLHGEGPVEEGLAAERIVVALLAVLRVGTLALGVTEIKGTSGLVHPAAARIALLALAAQSAAVFALAAWRLRRGTPPILGSGVATVETLAGVAGLLVLANAMPLSLRTTSSFWIQPYTVISALVLAAAARRLIGGAFGAACLTAAYLAAVFVVAPGGATVSSTARATALANAISYLPFFAIGAIGFAVLRSVVGQTDALRRLLSRLPEERARVTAAEDAYRLGHDIPKALLRELRRGQLSVAKLRPLASEYRERLIARLSDAEREAVDLREEIAAIADVFAVATTLSVDLDRFGEVPAGAPTVVIAEAVRELLNNASYHAHGSAVTLTARSSPERVRVVVHDDGPGVDPARLVATWALKQNTLHLLEVAGGGYEIQSGGSVAGTSVAVTSPAERAAGTTVTVMWPAACAAGTTVAVTRPAARARARAKMPLAPCRPMLQAQNTSHTISHQHSTSPEQRVEIGRRSSARSRRRAAIVAVVSLFALLLAVFGAAWYASGRLMSIVHVHDAHDRYAGDPATALGLRFSSVTVPTPLGGMPAWYVPGRRSTWVILIHGLGGSRTDTLPPMPALHALGYPLLAISYRNDVGAPPAGDRHSHLGASEWRDAAAAIDYAVGHGAGGVVLYGYSLGGAIALILARDPAFRGYVRAVVLDSPLLDWPATMDYAARREGIPRPFAELTETLLSWRAGIDYSQFDQLAHERQLSAPVLLFQGTDDTVVPPRLAARFARERPGIVTYVPIAGADHVSGIDTDPHAYEGALRRFLARLQ